MKNLKKFFSTFLVMAVCAMFSVSCGDLSPESLAEITKEQCPKSMGGNLTLVDVTYEDKVLTYEVEMDESAGVANLANLTEEDIDKMKSGIVGLFTSQKDDPTVNCIVKNDLTWTWNYSGSESGELFSFDITADDLK